MKKLLNFILVFTIAVFWIGCGQAENLKQAVLRTVHSNPAILFQAKNISAMNEAVKGAKGGFLPSLDVYANYGQEKSNNSSTNFSYLTLSRQEVGAMLRENIFNGFGTISEVNRNKARLSSAKYKTQGVADDVALNAITAYVNVLRKKEVLNYSVRNYNQHKKIFSMIKQRTGSGLSRRADLDQATGRLALAKANMFSAQNEYQNALTTYQKVTGALPNGLSSLQSPNASALPKTESAAVAQALTNHPTLKSAHDDIAAAESQNRAAKSLNYPSIDIVLAANNRKNIDGVRGDNNDRYAMVEMNYNLFRGGSDFARQKETAYYIQQANEVKNLTKRQVVESMKLSWEALQTAKNQLYLFKQHRDAAIKTAKAYKQQYHVGKRTLLDLLNSENEVFASQRTYVDGRYHLMLAKYRVLNSEGVLLPYLGINTISANT